MEFGTPKTKGKILTGRENEATLDYTDEFQTIEGFSKQNPDIQLRIVSLLSTNDLSKESFVNMVIGETDDLEGLLEDEDQKDFSVKYWLRIINDQEYVMIFDVSNELLKKRPTLYFFLLKLSSCIYVILENALENENVIVRQSAQLSKLQKFGYDVNGLFPELPKIDFFFNYQPEIEGEIDGMKFLTTTHGGLFKKFQDFSKVFPNISVKFPSDEVQIRKEALGGREEDLSFTLHYFVNNFKDLVVLNNMDDVDVEQFLNLLGMKRNINSAAADILEKMSGFDEKPETMEISVGSPEKLDMKLQKLTEDKDSNEALQELRVKLEAMEVKLQQNESMKAVEGDIMEMKLRLNRLEKDILESGKLKVLQEKVKEARKIGVENEDGFVEVYPDGKDDEKVEEEEEEKEMKIEDVREDVEERHELEARVAALENSLLEKDQANVELEKKIVALEKLVLAEEPKRIEEEKKRAELMEKIEALSLGKAPVSLVETETEIETNEERVTVVSDRGVLDLRKEVDVLKEFCDLLQDRIGQVDRKHEELAEGQSKIDTVSKKFSEDMRVAEKACSEAEEVRALAENLKFEVENLERNTSEVATKAAEEVFEEKVDEFLGRVERVAKEKLLNANVQGVVNDEFSGLVEQFKKELGNKIMQFETSQRTSKEEFDIIITEMINHAKEMEAFKKSTKSGNKLYRVKLLKEIDQILFDFKNRVIVGSFQKGMEGRVTEMQKLVEDHAEFIEGLKRVGISGVGTSPSYKYTKSLYYLEHMTDDFKKHLMHQLTKSGHQMKAKKKAKRKKKLDDIKEKKRVPMLRLNKVLEKTRMLQKKREEAMSQEKKEDAEESTLSFHGGDFVQAGDFDTSLLEQVKHIDVGKDKKIEEPMME